jgi:DNA-binding CsgD family transcriptional regulator
MSWVAAGRLLEAVHDDTAFTQVVGELAAQIGARSFFGAFGLSGSMEAVVASNGWWTGPQLDLYERDFLAVDPCAAALLANWRPQQVIDLERVIGSENIARSRLYQDFIRPMGDDTFRALGLPFEGVAGKGAITFQRGEHQARFGNEEIARLVQAAPELAQLFILRSHMARLDQAVVQRGAALDAMDEPLLIVRRDARLVHANCGAELELRLARVIELHGGMVRAVGRDDRGPFRAMLAAAGAGDRAPGGGVRMVDAKGNAIEALAVALLDGTVLVSLGATRTAGMGERLREIYGLSPGEADVAIRLWAGETVDQIAAGRGTSRHTVRLQVRAICDKMGCSRQVEIVSRIAALPRLRQDIPQN